MRQGREGSQHRVSSRACDLSVQQGLNRTRDALRDNPEAPLNCSMKRQGSWSVSTSLYPSLAEDCSWGINSQHPQAAVCSG